jgi:hypothetical protein
MEKKNGVEEVDIKFDKAERIWDRLQKLLLKIVGGVVGISLAVYIAYGQLKEKHREHFEQEKIEHAEEIKKITQSHNNEYYNESNNNPTIKHDIKQQYMILSRLQSDCEYYLGQGNRDENGLYHGDVKEHIQAMKELWIKLDKKPEWITMKDIIDYERKMKVSNNNTDNTVVDIDTVEDTITNIVEDVVEDVTPVYTPISTPVVIDEEPDTIEENVEDSVEDVTPISTPVTPVDTIDTTTESIEDSTIAN